MALILLSDVPAANAEYIWRVAATNKIVRLAVPNERRLAGLIRNLADTELFVRFGAVANLQASDPYIKLAPRGGNVDIPPNFIGEIFGVWAGNPHGFAALHHYYNTTKSKLC